MEIAALQLNNNNKNKSNATINKQKKKRTDLLCVLPAAARLTKTISDHKKHMRENENQKETNKKLREKNWAETDNCMPFYIKHIESDISRLMRSGVI